MINHILCVVSCCVATTVAATPANELEPPCEFQVVGPGSFPAHSYINFGIAVGLSGEFAAIGADLDGSTGHWPGTAYIFERSMPQWTRIGRLFASDGQHFDNFGHDLDIDGDLLIVGAPSADGHEGAAYVFRYDGQEWGQEAKLTASDSESGDLFGTAVAVDSGVVVVGAYHGGPGLRGAAYVYRKTGGEWIEEAKLTASDGEYWHEYGFSVDIETDTIVVGARSTGPFESE